MPSCAVKACKNYVNKCKKSRGITFHLFPTKHHLKDEWIQIIRNCRGENNWNPSRFSRVCSAHFDDDDFKTSIKGLRSLDRRFAVPKRLLSNSPEKHPQIQTTSTITLQVPVIKEEIVVKEELALNGYCRLCAASNCDNKLINVDSDNVMKELVVNMLNRLNTNIDFQQDHLPTYLCSLCVQALYTAYDFVVGIDLAQTTLNKILAQKCDNEISENFNLGNNMELSSTCYQQTSPKIEITETEFYQPQLNPSGTTATYQHLSPATETAPSNFEQQSVLSSPIPISVVTPEEFRLNYVLDKKNRLINLYRKKIKQLNQNVRRYRNRNESLKSMVKIFKERNYSKSTEQLNGNMIAADLYNNLNRKNLDKHLIYSKALKIFCLRLNFYSPKAYEYVRKSFETCLPHQKTLDKWYNQIKQRVKKT